jgi:protein TonB
MNTLSRRTAVAMISLASLCGCKAMGDFAVNSPTTVLRMVSSLFHRGSKDAPAPAAAPTAAPAAPVLAASTSGVTQHFPALDAYKTQVAKHVVQSNPEQTFSGKLPEMLPAIVVLSITVDRNGNLTDVAVQRYRDADAAWVAVTSMRVSDPLPKPVNLLASNAQSLTFSETFLFNADYRFQLRSLAGPQ